MSALTANQKRAIRHAFLDVHQQLQEIEAALAQAADRSPFDRVVNDLSPTEAQLIRDYFARIRAAMVSCLREANIPLDVQRTSLRWTVQSRLMFVSVALEEIGPKQLAGYGPLTEARRAEILKLQDDVRRLIDRVSAFLRQGAGQDLGERIDPARLGDYASEEGNPGNYKHVTDILVRLPSPRLREGAVLVDTPGVGSLALAGAAETFAYLPRCDLGVVLIDAASNLNSDDLALIRAAAGDTGP
jgi:hypothetical protein